MAYTLRGRVDSRLAAALVPVLVACVLAAGLHAWWPVELAGLMLGVGLALDVLVYDRVFEYQPGWVAVPLGALELLLVLAAANGATVRAPLAPALGFYAGSWLLAQLLAHAGFPLLRLSYGDDGGELGRSGPGAAALTAVAFAAAGGIAWANLPPTVHLSAGVHRGPLVITKREVLIGERGAVVHGGIVIRADGVTVRNVATLGGEYGFDVEESRHVTLDGVRVTGASLDGIHVRRSRVTIRNCIVDSPAGWTQGIDLSFNADKGMSMIEGCTVVGGRQGIVVDSSGAMVSGNRVSSTSLQAITMTEMSMGMIEGNEVTGALGAGIVCDDQSMCMIERNRISGTRADRSTDAQASKGYGIVSNYKAEAELRENELLGNAGGVAAFAGGVVTEP
jgi:parallel beta helix pectate lyase-like protein